MKCLISLVPCRPDTRSKLSEDQEKTVQIFRVKGSRKHACSLVQELLLVELAVLLFCLEFCSVLWACVVLRSALVQLNKINGLTAHYDLLVKVVKRRKFALQLMPSRPSRASK